MKLLILSDSHSQIAPMDEVLRDHPDIAMAIHLGDYVRDANIVSKFHPSLPFSTVAGNGDFLSNAPLRSIFEFGGKTIFACHGHEYRVKSGLSLLLQAARDAGADIALFGHTHVPYSDYHDGIYGLNPGSIGSPPGGRAPSYGILDVSSERFNGTLCQYHAKHSL